MTKWERVQAALRGAAVDRVPVSLWGHDFLREWSPEGLAEAMLERHYEYGWDFMKVNPRASSFGEDWGCRFQPSGDPLVAPTALEYPVKDLSDWGKIRSLNPHQGVLGEQLQALRLIKKGLAGDAPFVQTIFSPLSVAGRLAGNQEGLVKETMARDPRTLHRALSLIAQTLASYGRACIEEGASGIFFAATNPWASRDTLPEDAYREFGRPYDLQVLEAVQGTPFNILHICGRNIFFELLADYPVQAVNWAAALPGNPSIKEGLARTPRAVIGGIKEKTTLVEATPQEVASQGRAALGEAGGRRFLLGPGCAVPPQAPQANQRAVRQSVEPL